MFNKSKLLIKRFISSTTIKTTLPPLKCRQSSFFFPPHKPTKPFKTPAGLSKIKDHPFSSSQDPNQDDSFKDEIALVSLFPPRQQARANEVLKKYRTCQDTSLFSQEEAQRILSLFQCFAAVYVVRKDMKKAHTYLIKADEICQKLNIGHTLEYAALYYAVVCFQLAKEELVEAEDRLDEVDRVCKLFSDDPKAKSLMVQSSFTRGLYHRKKNEKDKAIELFNSVLGRIDDVLEETKPKLLVPVYQEMGLIHFFKDDFDKAEEYFSKGLKIAIDYFGEFSDNAFSLSFNLADCLYANKKYQGGLYYIQKCTQIASKLFPADHPKIGRCSSLLGYLYLSNNEVDRALESFEKAIQIYEKSPQENFKALSELYYEASAIHHMQGKSQEASALFLKSDKMLANTNLENNPKDGEIYLLRAWRLKEQKRLDESEGYLRKAIEIYKGQDPLDKPRIIATHFLLSEILYEKEDWATALELFKENEKLFYEYSVFSLEMCELYSYLGALSIIMKDYDQGLE